ncbi:MAM and LDL-receptor class A domain-containing protein 1-like, partial [Ostrea edulis]|uniref:MAM and LDL-receptor class A domain-containing protein 1-like n=1 Tax=Ostrea edulis TaxID=37623 RepID=UPI0024AEE35D
MWKRKLSLWLVVILLGRVASVPPSSCAFDDGWCQWRPQNNSGNFEWHLGHGPTRDRSSGPDGDHTTKYGNGSYIFIRGLDAGRNASLKAIVETNLDATSDLQMSFWYFMNGIGIGNLTVNKVDDDGTKTELWRKEGRQGSEWIQAKVRLPRGEFMIRLEASARLFYGSDLAVDDIEFSSIITTTTLPPTTMPPFRALPVGCDFESGSCGWELLPSLGNTVGWNITSESYYYKEKMLIPGDMSNNQGKYLLLTNWDMGENGDAAQIVSPVLENVGGACLSFYLYLPSTSSGTLSIYQKLLPSMELVLLHEAAFRRPPGWKEVKFTLKESRYFQVILEGSYAGYLGSVIGVDGVTIKNGECIFTTTPETTTTTTTTTTALPTTFSPLLTTAAINSKTTVQKMSSLSLTPDIENTSPKRTTELKNLTSQVGTSSKPRTTQGLSTLSSSVPSHMLTSIPWSSTRTSFTTPTLTRLTHHSTAGSSTVNLFHTKPTKTFSSPDKSSLVPLTQVPQTTTNSLTPVSSDMASKSITLSPSHSSTNTPSEGNTQTPTRTHSFTVNATKSTPENPTSLSTSSSLSSLTSTSVILSSLLTNISAMISNFQPTASMKTTTMSKLNTSENRTMQHTSPLSIQTPDKKTTSSIETQTLSGSTNSSFTTRLPTSTTISSSSTTHQTSPSSNLSPESHNLAARETTAIVLGVCLPVILLVILSVIVLICKKDHSKSSSFQNQKTKKKKKKKPNPNNKQT